MHRRLLIATLATWPGLRLAAQPEVARPRQKISASQLLDALASRFPQRFSIGGVMAVELNAPALLLLSARNKLGATVHLEARGLALSRAITGELDALFALRHEPSDSSVRGHDPEIARLALPGLPPDAANFVTQGVQALLPRMMGDFVLHRFTERELALPNAMGFEPGSLTVREDGVEIGFTPKARP